MSVIYWKAPQLIPSTINGPMVNVRVPGDLIIGTSCLATPTNACKGLHIQVYGNCYIFGTLSMTQRGATAPGDNLGLEFYADRNLISYNSPTYSSLPLTRRISAAGAAGAATTSGTWPSGRLVTGNTGTAGMNGQTGGGGAGAVGVQGKGKGNATIYNRPGGPGTCYSGGPGSGGVVVDVRNDSAPSADYGYVGVNGGKGGDSYAPTRGAGSGAGNPAGTPTGGNAGQSGTGGLLILVVTGFLYIASSGLITADGSPGGVAGGAGSGGGSVNLYYGALVNLGTIRANGGAGAIMQNQDTIAYGGSGGAGSVRTHSLRAL